MQDLTPYPVELQVIGSALRHGLLTEEEIRNAVNDRPKRVRDLVERAIKENGKRASVS